MHTQSNPANLMALSTKKKNRRLHNLGVFIEPLLDHVKQILNLEIGDRVPIGEISAIIDTIGARKIHPRRKNLAAPIGSKRQATGFSSPYIVFQREARPLIKETFTREQGREPRPREVMKLLGERWRAIANTEEAKKFNTIWERERTEKKQTT